MSQAFQTLLNDFAQYHQMPVDVFLLTQELRVGSATVSLLFEGDEGLGEIVFLSELGSPQPGEEQSTYALLLQANHLWFGTDGATLGLTPDGTATIGARLPLEGMDVETLSSLLTTFADTAAYWQNVILGRNNDEPAETSPTQS